MKTTMTATLVLLATAAAPAAAQAVGQADVQIQSLSVTAARVRPTLAPAPRGGPRPIGAPAPAPTIGPADALSIQVVVLSNNDDDAQNVQLNIFLPPESRVLSLPAGCAAFPVNSMPSGAVSAFVTCGLGALYVNATRAVGLTITRPPSYVAPRVGVFAWSETPDPNTGNNHDEKVAP